MQSLNAQLSRRIDETLVPLIAGHSERICIIDPPGYANVGDSAIFLGERAFLRRNFPDARIDFFDTVNYTRRDRNYPTFPVPSGLAAAKDLKSGETRLRADSVDVGRAPAARRGKE